ncbi:probable leucine--tRNA ligase, mitochondrial isoform X2 [Anabrus simplex]
MFPYPSGQLHMGHVRVYTISDTMARFHRLNGKNVFHPMGWDAFGLPAENAAIEHGVEPRAWTQENIAQMKEQLKDLGCAFDWKHELATCEPEYYHWTQYLFLKLYDAGLVYQKESLVNWDPVDQTVLADEQVDASGCSWRSGAKVEKKVLTQWFIRTTHFSKSLVEGLDDPVLENWRDITSIQKHWIGECNGTNIQFELEDRGGSENVENNKRTLTVWTDKPELIYAASFIAVTPNSVLGQMEKKSGDASSTNELFQKLSVWACNPFTGKFLPIFVTDQMINYVPGTDVHLGIPDVCESDRLFAVAAKIPVSSMSEEDAQALHSGEDVNITRERICEAARQRGLGGYPTSSKLRDWLISRQRYWGTPIPIVHCNKCGPQPVPVSELPVVLPVIDKLVSKGRSPLLEAKEWLNTTCPKCGGNATRETDTMDTFVDSSWYFLRYLNPHNTKEPFSKEQAAELMPVDLYIGGKEHAALHLYYARFFNHFLHSKGLVPHPEPFKKLLVQGMVMGRSYRVKGTGRYLPAQCVDLSGSKPVEKGTGHPVVAAWEKMSKSKHNGVDPKAILKDYGVDTTRLLILGDVAPTSHRNWSTDTFPGILKWQNRLWLTMRSFLDARSKSDSPSVKKKLSPAEFDKHEEKMWDSRNYYVKGVNFNYSVSYQLSVAISKMQGLTNSLRQAPPEVIRQGAQFERALASQIIMLAPMAPHFASELWSRFLSAPNRLNTSTGEILWNRGVLEQVWPCVDMNYCLELVCKVNGIENCSIRLPRLKLDTLSHDDALELALYQAEVQQFIAGYKIVNTYFTLHPSYEAVINIVTDRFTKQEKRKRQDG